MTGFELLRPLWLLGLPLVVILATMSRRRHDTSGDWGRVSDAPLLAALQHLGRLDPPRRNGFATAAFATAIVIVLALSGPAVERRDAATFRNLDGVVFVIDASPSMTESAQWMSAQSTIRFAIAALASRPAGLIVFAGDAYVASDMTTDTRELGQTLSLVGPDTVPDPGTRPERGLELALEMLTDTALLTGDVILVTDGAGAGPESLAVAGALADRDIRLSVVAPDSDDPTLETLAATGGGEIFELSEPDALAAFLTVDARTRLERQEWPMLFSADFGRLLLALALVPALALMRRTST